ncbi:MAG: DUF3781 domain-containing protein [Firmicutes bacterium]|nr:DUF3781 domain-containing protein [Bacillota bacterium]
MELDLQKLKTTPMGVERIKRNLGLEVADVVEYCKQLIASTDEITRKGKNWYVCASEIVITINAYSHTIITAHKRSKK